MTISDDTHSLPGSSARTIPAARAVRPLYVYLQRPDNGEWVTVGRYSLAGTGGQGVFRYAPSYVDAGLSWSIDPVNLPLRPGLDQAAPRYHGLHDVLRDASPDSWGQAILRKEHALAASAHPVQYLIHAKNGDRWGALAIGSSPRPSVSLLASPKLPSLGALVAELQAMAAHQPPVSNSLRKMLVGRPSLGGARPKGVIQDGDTYWLVKPLLATDTADIPLLEHTAAQLGRAVGLDIAETVYQALDRTSVLRVKRFDRRGERRLMALSAASLLETEFPGNLQTAQWSYPRLAEQLLRIGAAADRRELFLRMVFNAVLGNDDDHPRNHAVVHDHELGRWRLSQAYDIVPAWDYLPDKLAMQTSLGSFEISRASILRDAIRFGMEQAEAALVLDEFLARLGVESARLIPGYPAAIRAFFEQRVRYNMQRLQG